MVISGTSIVFLIEMRLRVINGPTASYVMPNDTMG